jgi:hypothetical protein
MRRGTIRGFLALWALSIGLAPGGARAQLFGLGGVPTPPSGGTGATAATTTTGMSGLGMGMSANPFLNPYMSPFLNGGINQQQITPANAAMYLFAAQAANGGIGSGRLGGARPAPGSTKAKPATTTDSRPSSNTPGAGAARYFNRTTAANTGANSYYSRQSNHFPRNGR